MKMSSIVDFKNVSTDGLESSPVAEALAGLRANEARYFMNKYSHEFAASPLETSRFQVENIRFARQKSKLAGTIRGSFFVIKGEY